MEGGAHAARPFILPPDADAAAPPTTAASARVRAACLALLVVVAEEAAFLVREEVNVVDRGDTVQEHVFSD